MKFRKDINGLRAYAVIAVVIFHFFPQWLPGGFAGVDVFFVISGFLMTAIIGSGLEQHQFSLARFYRSRAARIVPALAVMYGLLLVAGAFTLLPDVYETLGKHVQASMLFFSNFVYYGETGYFDAGAKEKWLLHTWSLATEWQFYLIYPIILMVLARCFSWQNTKRIILLLAIIMLVTAEIITRQDPSQAYYLLSGRMWEMLAGGLVYLYPMNITKKYCPGAAYVGLLMIVVSYFIYDKQLPWPGYFALLPIVGAWLLLQANHDTRFTHWAPMQWIGKWSYSIYLWHWPLLVLCYHLNLTGMAWSLAAIATSILVGALSYHYLEQIKWHYPQLKRLSVLRFKPVLLLLGVGITATVVKASDGIEHRPTLPDKLEILAKQLQHSPLRTKCHANDDSRNFPPSEACHYFNDNTTWATIGDSHMVELSYEWAKQLKKVGQGLVQYTFSGCPPSYHRPVDFSACQQWTDKAVQLIIDQPRIQKVMVNYRYSEHLAGDPWNDKPAPSAATRQQMLAALDNMIERLAAAKQDVYVFLPILELGIDIQSLLTRDYLHRHDVKANIEGVSRAQYERRNQFILEHFRQHHYPDNVHFLDTTKQFCDRQICYAVRNNKPFYFDDNHASLAGADRMLELLPAPRASTP